MGRCQKLVMPFHFISQTNPKGRDLGIPGLSVLLPNYQRFDARLQPGPNEGLGNNRRSFTQNI